MMIKRQRVVLAKKSGFGKYVEELGSEEPSPLMDLGHKL
jgi:hypothetical protein